MPIETDCPPEFIPICDLDENWLSPKEFAAAIGMTPQYVRLACESGEILCHVYNSSKVHQRKAYRIPRSALKLYLARSANYNPRDIVRIIGDIINRLPMKHVLDLGDAVARRMRAGE